MIAGVAGSSRPSSRPPPGPRACRLGLGLPQAPAHPAVSRDRGDREASPAWSRVLHLGGLL